MHAVTGPFGHTLTFTYDATNRVTAVTGPDGSPIQYGYDGIGNLTTVTYPDTTSRTYHYEYPTYPHALTGITDESGVRYATFGYDANGLANLTQHAVTENGSAQERFSLTYDSAQQTTVVDGRGLTKVLTFAENLGSKNLLSAVNQSDGKAVLQSFDARNNLLTRTDEENRITQHTYNSSNQRTSMIEAAGTSLSRTTTYQYVSSSLDLPTLVRKPSVYSGSFYEMRITYDTNLNVDTITEAGFTPTGQAVSRTTSLDYNTLGQLERIDGPRTDAADITLLNYYACNSGSECGRLQSISNALGHTVTFDSYDANGRLTEVTDANGLATAYAYDPRGRLVSVAETPPGGQPRATSFTYTPTGLLETSTSPEGVVLTYSYDAAHYLRSIGDGSGGRIEYSYDLSGNRVEESVYDPTDTLVRAIQTTYDIRNQVASITELGNVTQVVYDASGNLDEITDANSQTTDPRYDSLNRVYEVVDALVGLTQIDYDARDQVARVITPNGATTQYAYDDLGNLLQESSPDRGAFLTYTYDEAGNRLSMTTANGDTTQYTYDALNRLLDVIHPQQTASNIQYFYDDAAPGQYGIGRLTQIVEQIGSTAYEYDPFGNVTKDGRTIDNTYSEARYAYNLDDQLIQVIYPSGRLANYIRDNLGKVASVTTQENAGAPLVALATNVQHLPFGPTIGLEYGNGIDLTVGYDQAFRVSTMNAQSATNTVQDLQFGYDSVGNVTAMTDLRSVSESQTFTYDPLSRLETAQGAYGNITFDYDANGNRTLQSSAVEQTSYDYLMASNRLTSTHSNSEDWMFGYDANGSITSKTRPDGSGWLYGYNSRDRLESVTQREMVQSGKGNKPPQPQDTVVGAYEYNALGQRSIKSTAADSTQFVYGLSGELLVEADAEGNRTEYVYLDGQPIAAYQIKTTPSAPPEAEDVVIDNGAAGTVPVGTWNPLTSNKDFGADYLLADGGTGASYTWTPSLSGGEYEVYAWWVNKQQYSHNVTYTIHHDGQDDNVSADHSANGGTWNLLGTFTFSGDGTEYIRVTDANGKTVADAVRFNKVLTPPPPQVQQATYFIHTDHLGTPQRLTDEFGSVVWEVSMTPFGQGTPNEDVDGDGVEALFNPRFPGQYYDAESGLHYNYFRDYDAATGRYVESDPIGLAGGLNSYAYVENSAISFVDPFGLAAWPVSNGWTESRILAYAEFAKMFVETYNREIDCADLALLALMRFAAENALPVRLKYWSRGTWGTYDASSDAFSSAAQFERTVLQNMGALNVIDNTVPIAPDQLRSGDFLMTKYSSTLGHTRVVTESSCPTQKCDDPSITWYQGNLPPVVPQKRTGSLSGIDGKQLLPSQVPRRWNFRAFR